MAENKSTPRKPNLLQRRVSGAVKPRESYQEDDTPTVEKSINTGTQDENNKLVATSKRKLDNQKKSIKVGSETYKDLATIKSMEKLKFDYEIIQLLVDEHIQGLSDSDSRRYTLLRENL